MKESEKKTLPPVKNFEDLLIWQQGMQLVKEIYKITKGLPKEELYGIVSQIRRSSLSVPLNIAEGHTRDSTKEYLYFLSISAGSLAEVKTLLILCVDLEYMLKEKTLAAMDLTDKTIKMICNLQRKLRNSNSLTP